MLLAIHDANLQKVAFIDNDKQTTLNYYNDTWTRNLETGSSTFEFTVVKKAIQSDTATNKTYNLLNEKAFVSFQYKGKNYVFSVMTVEEDEQTITCYCENLNLELINEYANPYKATKAMSFVEYCQVMDLLNFTHLSIGINEISNQKRTLEWEGQDTKLARLLSLANKFDAEIDFETQLNADSSIKSFKVNIYHENDDTHQGVGRVRHDITLVYGKNLNSIKRKIDKTGIYNAIRPTGKTKGGETESVVTIAGLPAWSENNADGVREFYQYGEMLYAPLSMQMYPSTFTSSTSNDQWIRKDMEVDSDDPTVIRAAGIAALKKSAYPSLTYDVDGYIDVDVGDTIKIYDDAFSPVLLVQARVSDQKISFTNPTSNKTTFANFKALENNLSDGIQAAFERLFEASQPYLIRLATDNGVIFKNQTGQTVITPTLYKGGKVISNDVSWRWSLDGQVSTGQTFLVRGRDVVDTVTLTVAAYVGNAEVAVDKISLVNVVDGKIGTPGTPGRDGRTPYIHFAYAESADGRTGFSLTQTGNKRYMGTYTDFEPADSTDPTRYKWVDMVGSVEIGLDNLLLNTGDMQNYRPQGNGAANVCSYDESDDSVVINVQDQTTNRWWGVTWDMSIKSIKRGETFSIRLPVYRDTSVPHNSNMALQVKSHSPNNVLYSYPLVNSAADQWQVHEIVFTASKDLEMSGYGFYIYIQQSGKLKIGRPLMVRGNIVPKTWVAAQKDLEAVIDTKADNELTQEQLTMLQEQANLMQAELDAKATLAEAERWWTAFQEFQKSNAKQAEESERELIESSRRMIAIENSLGDTKERWSFLDRYMDATEEGLIIGKKDGSSTIKINDGRISMVSAGKEVMYITQGVIHIDNGVFTKTLQVGYFRTEQYENNPYMNVIRFVGG